jgi:organic radical activating enzyme
MEAQVFQNAACAWRCWYCFVPYNLLNADPKRSAWLSAEELVALYKHDEQRPQIIDLSGGSPDLVPEWVPWMMQALSSAGLDRATYLWSDDNLSTRYLFEKLSA